MNALSGGAALQRTLDALASKMDKAREVRVGFLEGKTYPDGTSVPMVAAIQEFGSPEQNIPARPFFRRMIAEKSPEWGQSLGKLLAHGNYDSSQALDAMGMRISEQLRDSIIGFTDPPLSPKTIAAKGFATPLIDTGVMLNSIDFEVIE